MCLGRSTRSTLLVSIRLVSDCRRHKRHNVAVALSFGLHVILHIYHREDFETVESLGKM